MKELRSLVWRLEAGYGLPEAVRDSFLREIEGVRDRARKLLRAAGEVCLRATPEGGLAREVESTAVAAERDARALRFRDALAALEHVASCLDKMEEIILASRTIERTEARILELEALLGGASFTTIDDFHILMIRARWFLEKGKYRTARFVAQACEQEIDKLNAPAAAGAACPEALSRRLLEQRALSAALDALGIASDDASRIRAGIAAIESALARRCFDLMAALMLDLENANAQIESFVRQLRLSQRGQMAASLILRTSEGKIDWLSISAALVAESMDQASERLSRRALAAAAD